VSTGSELQDSSRHALGALARPLATGLAAVLGDRFLAVLLLSAGLGAAASAASSRCSTPIPSPALLFAALLAVSASVWFLSALPETFGQPPRDRPRLPAPGRALRDAAAARRRFLAYAAYSVAALGATLTNFVYAGLGQLANVARRGGSRRGQAGVLAAYPALRAAPRRPPRPRDPARAGDRELPRSAPGLARLDALHRLGKAAGLEDLAALAGASSPTISSRRALASSCSIRPEARSS
jgi:hypothetical protein